MDSDDAGPTTRFMNLPTAGSKRLTESEDLASAPRPPQPVLMNYRNVVMDDDAAPAKRSKILATAGSKHLSQSEDLSSTPHPSQPAPMIMIKDKAAPAAAKNGTPEVPKEAGDSSPHPPPSNGDGAPPAKRFKTQGVLSPLGRPPKRQSADMNFDSPPPAKKINSTALTKEFHFEDLPDDLAIDILLRLSTADAARVSTLSRRCRKIWSLLPVLDFICSGCPPSIRSISSALSAHDKTVEISYLSITLAHMAGSVSSLFRHAASLVIRELCFRSLYLVQGQELDAMLDRAWRKDQDYVDMPCFETASRISLRLGFLNLKMPSAGRFANLEVLHLACFGIWGKLFLSMTMFPVLHDLSLKRAFGIHCLDITSDSLTKIRLCRMIGLNSLIIKAPNLEVLNVFKCLEHVPTPEAEIRAPRLKVLRWLAPCHLTCLSPMVNLRLLNPPVITAFGPEEFTGNEDSVNILQKFPAVKELELDIEVIAYNFGTHSLMQNIGFPRSEILSLHVKTGGHSSGASIMHILEMCSSIRVLDVTFEDLTNVRNRCPLMCSCDNPAGWAIQRSLMVSLKQVTIRCLNGLSDEFRFMKVLLKLAPQLDKVKLFVGPHFQCVRQKGKAIYFQDASKNVYQEIQILSSLVPVGTLELYEHIYDNKSDDYVLVPLRFDNEED